jgi:hypothetical protein
MVQAIFFHLFCVADFRDRFRAAHRRILRAGLLDGDTNIHLCAVGDPGDLVGLPGVVLHARTDASATFEGFTLDHLVAHCRSEPSVTDVLYLHGKGVTRPRSRTVRDWVALMQHFLIDRHEETRRALAAHDTVGVNFSTQVAPHYSGNFWWARADHLRARPPAPTDRRGPEFWLLGGPAVHAAEVFRSDVNHYERRFRSWRYRRPWRPLDARTVLEPKGVGER